MIYVGIGLILISVVLIFISIFRKNRSFFNMSKIVKDYFAIFNNNKWAYIVFYGYPLILAIGIALIYSAEKLFYDNLSIILSIILSMLFSVLSIITSFNYGEGFSCSTRKRVMTVVKETSAAIIFSVLLCVVLLLYSMVMLIVTEINFESVIVLKILSGIAYYVSAVLLLNLLLVIKRIGKIIDAKISDKEENK